MQLPEKNIVTDGSVGGTEESFGIGNIGLIFNILRNKLYSDPIGSIAREITSNARDAHREVGKPEVPIEIFIPHIFDLNWRVKDFGPGITPERMSKVFIQYANSTKRMDNIQTGGFGLGAKTPFAYSNQFTIITTTPDEKDNSKNIKRTYIAYIDETEVGKMRMVHEAETTDSTGTEIVLAIKHADVENFTKATLKYTQYWDVKPILKGVDNIPEYPQETEKVILSGKNWKIFAVNNNCRSYDSYDSHSLAVVDGVPYPISVSSMKNLTTHEQKLLSSNIRLDFAVGELALAANREQLQYDEITEKAIQERSAQIFDEVKDYLNNEINNLSSYRAAVNKYEEIKKNLHFAIPRGYVPSWKEHPIYGLAIKVPKLGAKIVSYAMVTSTRTYERYLSRASSDGDVIYLDPTHELYVNDIPGKKISRQRIHAILNEKGADKTVQIIHCEDSIDLISFIHSWKNPEPQSLINYTPFDVWVLEPGKLSDVVPVKNKETKKRDRERFDGWLFDNMYDPPRSKCTDKSWRPTRVDKKTGSEIYVVLNDGTEKKLQTQGLDKSKLVAMKMLLGKNIYGIRAVDVDKLGEDWIPLQDALQEKFEEIESSINIDDIYVAHNADTEGYSFTNTFRRDDLRRLLRKIVKKNPTSHLDLFIKESEKLENIRSTTKDIFVLLSLLNIPTPDIIKSGIRNLHCDVLERYPLLKSLSSHYGELCDENAVSQYINLVDEDLLRKHNNQTLQKLAV